MCDFIHFSVCILQQNSFCKTFQLPWLTVLRIIRPLDNFTLHLIQGVGRDTNAHHGINLHYFQPEDNSHIRAIRTKVSRIFGAN